MATRPKPQNIFKQLKRAVNHPMCYRIKARFTVAEINAGEICIPAPVGGGVRLHDVKVTGVGSTGAGSNVVLTGKQGGTDTILVTIAATSILTTTVIGPGSAGVTLTGIFINLCDTGQPVRIGKDAANITGLTALDVSVLYSIE